MPLIDVRCPADHTHEVQRSLADYPTTPPCVTCGQPTVQVHLPRHTQDVTPIVVYQAPDGSLRFPGARATAMVATYEKAGYQRVELRGAADMRRFEKVVNRREASIMARKLEHKLAAREYRESQTRSILRDHMSRMTPLGRDLARAAMRKNDDRPRERTGDPGFVSEVYSYDRSNRDTSRDDHGRRHRD